MNRLIRDYIEKIERVKSLNEFFAEDCIKALKFQEILLERENVLSKEMALNFFIERLKMQDYLEDDKRNLDESLIDKIKEIDDEKFIRFSDIIAEDCNYMLLETESDGVVFHILNGFSSLSRKRIIISHYQERKRSLPISFKFYHFKEGKLIEILE